MTKNLFFEIFHLLGLQILDHFNSAIEFGRHKSPNPADAQVSFFFSPLCVNDQKQNRESSDFSNSSIDFVAWFYSKRKLQVLVFTLRGNNNDNNNYNSSSSSLKCQKEKPQNIFWHNSKLF
jgi:hypothetical protein